MKQRKCGFEKYTYIHTVQLSVKRGRVLLVCVRESFLTRQDEMENYRHGLPDIPAMYDENLSINHTSCIY